MKPSVKGLVVVIGIACVAPAMAQEGGGPAVVAVSPEDGQAHVPTNASVRAEFSEPVDASTVTTATFLVQDCLEVTVPASIVVADDALSVTLVPDALLEPGTRYFVSLTDGITDAAGNPLEPATTSFLTASEHASGQPRDVDALGESLPGLALDGRAAGDRAGRSVAIVGDVDGDGLDDAVLGAPAGGDGPGRAFLVFGSEGLVLAGDDQRMTLVGETNGDHAGFSVGPAGDINGDGLADFWIGAPGYDGSVTGAGRVYVVFGEAGLPRGGTRNLGDLGTAHPGVILDGEATGDQAGSAGAGGADLSGDGTADLAVAAPRADTPAGDSAGRVYVLEGPLSSGSHSLGSVGSGLAGSTYEGSEVEAEAAFSVALWRDELGLDGDGVADLVIGVPGADVDFDGTLHEDAGEAVVVHGGASLVSAGPHALDDVGAAGPSGVHVRGTAVGARLGSSVSAIDVDAVTGQALLAVGATSADGCGRVEIWWSLSEESASMRRSGETPVFDAESDPSQLLRVETSTCVNEPYSGPGGDDFTDRQLGGLGSTLAFLGDVDRWPGDDLAVGLPAAAAGDLPRAGQAFVISGTALRRAQGSIAVDDVGAALQGMAFAGQQEQAQVGRALGGVGDVTGDGADDLLIGSSGAHVPSPDRPDALIATAGRAWLVGPSMPGPLRVGRQVGSDGLSTLEWDAVDRSVAHRVYRGCISTLQFDDRVYSSSMECLPEAWIGDVDGDGRPDLDDPEQPVAGESYFYLVVGVNDLGESPLGRDSAGRPRIHNAPCDPESAFEDAIPGQEDADADSLIDLCDNCPAEPNPNQLDTDDDDAGDVCDLDDDGDGLSDEEEALYGSDPLVADTDGDGLNDGEEIDQGTDPTLSDTDGDGAPDDEELAAGSNPNAQDTDLDGVLDGADNCPLIDNADQADEDGDGVGDACEYVADLASFDGGGPMSCPSYEIPNSVYGAMAAGESSSTDFQLKGGFSAAVGAR